MQDNEAKEGAGRLRLVALDSAPPVGSGSDRDTWADATGGILKDSGTLDGADAWGERYAPVQRGNALAAAQAGVAKLAPLGDACRDLIGRIASERRTVVQAPLAECRIDSEGRLTRGKTPLTLLEQAYRGLVARAPADVPSGLRGNINAWIGRKPDVAHLRVLRPQGQDPTAFAVVSDRYQAFDGDEAAALIQRTLPAECRGVTRYEGDGGRWQVEAHLARPFNAPGVARKDEIHSIVLRFRGADDGTGAVVFDAKAYRWICANGIKIADTAILGRVRHVGARDRFIEGITAAAAASVRAADSFASAWGVAGASRFECATTGQPLDAREAIHRLVEHKSLHVPHARELEEQILKAWEAERGDHVASVLNAATRAAHVGASAGVWRSSWYQDELEDQAGELLYAPGAWRLAPVAVAA